MSYRDGAPVRRVPPPPPPGFGDEEYYRLYGRPEEYHKYRRDLERRLKTDRGREDRSPGEIDELSADDEYDDYYDRRDYERRGYNDQYEPRPSTRPARRVPPPPLSPRSSTSLEDTELLPQEARLRGERPKFENFRVTITNESEGTPSLSGVDTEEEEEEDESEEEPPPPKERPRPPVKERLGKRIESDVEQKQARPPSSRSSRRRPVAPPKTPPPPVQHAESKKQKRNGKIDARKSSSSRRRRTSSRRDRSQSGGRKAAAQSRSPPPSSRKKKKKGKRRSGRGDRRSGKSGSGLVRRMEDTNKENQAMMRRLARRQRGKRKNSEMDTNEKLARLAGVDIHKGDIPQEGKHDQSVDSYDSEEESLSDGSSVDSRRTLESRNSRKTPDRRGRRDRPGLVDDGPNGLTRSDLLPSTSKSSRRRRNRSSRSNRSNRGRSDDRGTRSRDRGRPLTRSRSRSPVEKPKSRKSPAKWQHDKFTEAVGGSPIVTPRADDESRRTAEFGSHWSRIRSERSKERERDRKNRSRSRSSSRHRRRRRRRSSSRSRRGRRSYSSYSDSTSGGSSRSDSYSDDSYSGSSSSSESDDSDRDHRRRRPKRPSPKANRKKQPVARATAPTHTSTKSSQPPSQPSTSTTNAPTNEKDGPNFGLSGKLAEDTNTVNGVVLKYSEPPEARKPKTKWRLYVFKGDEELPILYIHGRSSYLLGRDRRVADIPLDHPSCSKQHAVLQYRLVDYTRKDGSKGRRVTPYMIDLNSANGSFVNNKKIESQKYVQLMEKDVLKFGFSSREYVLLHDQSKDDEDDLGVE